MPDASARSLRASLRLVALLLLPAALLAAMPTDSELRALLLLDREQLFAGELWRAVTGHWVHLSAGHFFWDAATFALLGVLCDRADRRAFLTTIACSAVAVSLAVLLARPDLAFYGGLSGVDSALFGMLAVTMLCRGAAARDRVGVLASAALICAFASKTAHEWLHDAAVFVSADDALSNVPIAHVVGFLVGGVVAGVRSLGVPPRPADVTGVHAAT